eukprot:m.146268 g.146268  ORF g.146268 m.146268 type:complete len:89 (+) comp14136_c0_seq1:91-357(+)
MENATPPPQSKSTPPTECEQAIFCDEEMCIAQLWAKTEVVIREELKDLSEWATLQARFRQNPLPKEDLRGWNREYFGLHQQCRWNDES